jgi:N-acetylglucosaminyl-diphospho-decaprenol L-rhamnosyltransferase
MTGRLGPEGAQSARVSSQHITLAVIVVSYKVRDLLRACLEATYASLAASPELDATVWVLDNASGDGSAEMVAQEFPQARLIARPENLGFAGGNNVILQTLGFTDTAKRTVRTTSPDSSRRAEHLPELVLLLNPDAEPIGGAIGQMARFLITHSSAGGAGAQLQYPDGRFQHGAFAFPGLMQLWFDLFPPRPARLLDSRLNGRYPRSQYDAGVPFPIGFALGAALMVRREAIQAAGLLDESYFMYAEEVDWCWRIQRAGWPFYCVPTACVIHHGGASTRQFRSQSTLSLWRSRRKLYTRFYRPVKRLVAGDIVWLGMWAETRRATAARRRGEIDAAEERERIETAAAVRRLFAQRGTT